MKISGLCDYFIYTVCPVYVCYVVNLGKYRYHAVKEPYPTEIPFDMDLGYIDVNSVVVQNEYIFVQVRYLHCELSFFAVTHTTAFEDSVIRKFVGCFYGVIK